MNPIRSVKNQYRGVNAHLHSYFQESGTWVELHNSYITHMVEMMQVLLIPMGYFARAQPSLQIRRYETSTAPLREKQYAAATIHELKNPHPESGEPVAWIELLSPTNKGNSEDARSYRAKRERILHGGVVFVEIDLLHETPPSLIGIPDYTTRKNRRSHPDAHPYRIAVIDPRPKFQDSKTHVKEFDVDEVIPRLPIPLNAEDILTFDFGAPYTQVFERMMFGMIYVDYAQLPVRFERYSDADQARIARRMLAVLQAHEKGETLERDPLPVNEIPLETALDALKTHLTF